MTGGRSGWLWHHWQLPSDWSPVLPYWAHGEPRNLPWPGPALGTWCSWSRFPATHSPKENLHDNNPCADDEELFEGLCYAKCAILSAGMKPVRCAAHICEPLDSNGQHKCQLSETAITSILSSPSLMPCHGYDIAGTREGRKRCPHSPGACLKDEELYLGCPGSDQWKFLDPKMEVLYHIFSHIFFGIFPYIAFP